MKTLIITHSYDVTTDLLMQRLTPDRAFRLNYDQFLGYELDLRSSGFHIQSAQYSISSSDVAKVVWRKPFNEGFESDKGWDPYTEAEIKYVVRELFNLLSREGKRVFGWPSADQRLGKLCQLKTASKYFQIPSYRLVQSKSPQTFDEPTIVKSLAGKQLANGKVLYTTDVTGKALSPSLPWFTQSRISADFDLTTVFVCGSIFTYRLQRRLFQGLDWRKNAFELSQHWDRIELSAESNRAISNFMAEVELDFGRLDFLANDNLSDLTFLEVNPNGQWAWLDPACSDGLFDEVARCLHPDVPHGYSR